MILPLLINLSLLASALDTSCDDILCSNINDYVCASLETSDGIDIFMIYQNICYLRRKQCQLRNYVVLKEMPHKYCNIKNEYPARTPIPDSSLARRVSDFSIIGAHQACNHTCPTYCTDDYSPACAQIWERHSEESFSYRPMINHCHIDLFSCASGLNVTVKALNTCYQNPTGLMFMMHMAGLKSLGLIEDGELGRQR